MCSRLLGCHCYSSDLENICIYVYPYMYYLCMHMNVHVFTCTSCHAFMPNQISFPISLFSNSFSDSENLALILHNMYTHFFSIRTLLNILSFFSLLSSSLPCFRRHSTHHCPPLCDIRSLYCHFSYPCSCSHQIPPPLPTHLLRCCCLSPGWQGTGRWEGKKITGPFH